MDGQAEFVWLPKEYQGTSEEQINAYIQSLGVKNPKAAIRVGPISPGGWVGSAHYQMLIPFTDNQEDTETYARLTGERFDLDLGKYKESPWADWSKLDIKGKPEGINFQPEFDDRSGAGTPGEYCKRGVKSCDARGGSNKPLGSGSNKGPLDGDSTKNPSTGGNTKNPLNGGSNTKNPSTGGSNKTPLNGGGNKAASTGTNTPNTPAMGGRSNAMPLASRSNGNRPPGTRGGRKAAGVA
ncbi:hypothetical protein GGTG_05137 [Gaeumannomyces tritici R3-111a-1]|uniref:Uncharacterized protein n=1 Tax=Gaeumannomyces tritici (strain R3-111a-1) TaxID=644352 RepID=J3NV28_GAET3|nr:hypothetical protein GGTG_05137 [Gaeumannomyces tritici R3-111a-1]EJT75200.1 hypothetical protein GGTG_05137 [Gaeumannomyces tritici R3-111a-1]